MFKPKKYILIIIMITISISISCSSDNDETDSIQIKTTTTETGKYSIVDTNQTECHDSTTGSLITCLGIGYDAELTKNHPDYTVSNDTLTVTDNITGLIWTRTPDINSDNSVDADDKLSQSNAVEYCTNLSLGGYEDWRLPDIKTLYSLMDFSGKDPSGYNGTDTSALTPFISDVFEPGHTAASERIIDGQYATTSIYVYYTNLGHGNTETMFGVNFVDGRIKGYPTDRKTYYVHCVRENEDYGLNNYTDNDDRTISDLATGLMWQKTDIESTDFEDAIQICKDSTTGNYSDWRLPNIKTLHSIVDYSKSPDTSNNAAINSIFSSTSFINEGGEKDWGFYWSSTTHVNYNNIGTSGAYISFGRALGYVMGQIYDVHGAGAQRSNHKMDVSLTPEVDEVKDNDNTFYYHGPQGDILRENNMVRCVRDI